MKQREPSSATSPRRQPARWRSVALVVVWLAASAGGLLALIDHSTAPGEPAVASPNWPRDAFERALTRPTLVVFAHPLCPCTLATIGEVERIATRCGDALHIEIIGLETREDAAPRAPSAIERRASAIPGGRWQIDAGGLIARSFGARTSGQAFLYDANGRLLFEGGLTSSRGHEGENVGASSVVALVGRGAPNTARTPVFGCSLVDGHRTEPAPGGAR